MSLLSNITKNFRMRKRMTESELSTLLGIDGQGHTIIKKAVSGETIANGSLFESEAPARDLTYKDGSGANHQLSTTTHTHPLVIGEGETPAGAGEYNGQLFYGTTGDIYIYTPNDWVRIYTAGGGGDEGGL